MEIAGNAWADKILNNIRKVIIGKDDVSLLLLSALLADGHVLLEDVPGTGKTKLAKTLARSLSADFSRIQFTPDLLPSDVTGLSIYDQQKNEFVLRKGPVFTNILLADEINRATPRTQAGLLECMEERQVTIDGQTLVLSRPFFVIATQNPVETSGTFPLPEAQLDRFIMKLSLGLPSRDEELAIVDRYIEDDPLQSLESVLSLAELQQAKREANKVFVHHCVREYIVDITLATRSGNNIVLGAGPRGSLAMLRCSKAYAYLKGRSFVTPDDVRAVAVPALAHRLTISYGYGKSGESRDYVTSILKTLQVPTEDFSV